MHVPDSCFAQQTHCFLTLLLLLSSSSLPKVPYIESKRQTIFKVHNIPSPPPPSTHTHTLQKEVGRPPDFKNCSAGESISCRVYHLKEFSVLKSKIIFTFFLEGRDWSVAIFIITDRTKLNSCRVSHFKLSFYIILYSLLKNTLFL